MLHTLFFSAFILISLAVPAVRAAGTTSPDHSSAQAAYNAGNFKDAYDAFSQLALLPEEHGIHVAQDLQLGTESLRRLGRSDETDNFLEKVIAAHPVDWRVLSAVAQIYVDSEHYGYIVAGKFYRGNHRGGDGRFVSTFERDHTRALQLMQAAAQNSGQEAVKIDLSDFYFTFARMLLGNREGAGSWRLQYLTDLTTLPDYKDGYNYYNNGGSGGAPVDEAGAPIFPHLPTSYDAAKTDGERWRWCLHQAAELVPSRAGEAQYTFASFLREQFDVQTLATYGYGGFFGREADDKKQDTSPFAVHTLGEEETIARLATGFKRFNLPEEFNFIHIFQSLAADRKSGYGEQSLDTLAEIFQDRQQYSKAARAWKESLEQYPTNSSTVQSREGRLAQIVGNWGEFEPAAPSPAGQAATVDFRFRNGQKASFEAYAIDVPKLLNDVKAYLQETHKTLDNDRIRLDDLGYRLVQQNQKEYVGALTNAWVQSLEPRPDHYDRRITITTPLKKGGAYLLKAKMAEGNTSQVVVWVADTVIVKKAVEGGALLFVADAMTGKPVGGANLDFFGYSQEWTGKDYLVRTNHSTALTDGDGQATLAVDKPNNYSWNWLITASTETGRMAYLGFTGIWHASYGQNDSNTAPHAFLITDRPVYRPEGAVKFKLWLGNGKYDQPEANPYAGQTVAVKIRDPKGTKIFEKNFTADQFGGLDGEFPLPADATLGQYSLAIDGWGGGSFRVEEYKKPEFEVTVEAPTAPVMLGEKITGTIRAKYYFGAPVTHAKVKYRVLRSNYAANWYPVARWDWLYNPGYWWFASDAAWYPGWSEWGIRRPLGWWWGGSYGRQQPEVVLENEVPIGPDGTVKVEIDTALAKLVHGDTDHRYEITAEVTDASRRTITGTGSVMAARKPFKVYAWVDRGYYHTGDPVQADFSAQTLDNKPIKGAGRLSLLKISYGADGKPTETAVEHWNLPTDADGKARLQIKAAEPGQYRLSYTVTDAKGRSIEGGYLFTVRGEGFEGRGFRFNDIELVPDKREYRPGDSVRLLINTERPGSTVALFLRPNNGVYLPPKILRLTGKSQIETIAVAQADMPNFFVEGITVSSGKVFIENREIVVPPENRVLTVQATPAAERYKPGEKAKLQVKLTGPDGKPFVGSTVVSLYDKSLDYISGGSNVPDIKTAFWSWKRSHYPTSETNVDRPASNWPLPGEGQMENLGVFGSIVADQDARTRQHGMNAPGQFGGGFGGGGRFGSVYSVDGNDAMPMGSLHASLRSVAGAVFASPSVGGEAQDGAANVREERGAGPAPGSIPPLIDPTIRKNFVDTALWVANLTTNKDGIADVDLTMPENLTTWNARVWSMGAGNRVGEGEAQVVTSKDLLVRLQAPRFFVQKDEVVLSANVHNYLKTRKDVQVGLQLDGPSLGPMGDALTPRTISVPANGETRADFRVQVSSPGQATVRVYAKTNEESDAMEMKFPVYIHGMLKTESFSGSLRPGGKTAKIAFRVPQDRIPAQSSLEIRYSPSVALAMVDALPYLVDYPYGCTEQTLNRFLPTVITQKILKDMKLDLKAIEQKRTNLNAQEIGNDSVRAADWKRDNPPNPGVTERNPVFDEDEVQKMVEAGISKLAAMQVTDGGWGWFSGYGEKSYAHTTALVVHGLQVARSNGVDVDAAMLARSTAWLKAYGAEQLRLLKLPTTDPAHKSDVDDMDAFVYMVLGDADIHDPEMREFIYQDRTHLSVYTKAMFGLALHKEGQAAELAMILQNISQFVVEEPEDETAYLKLPEDNTWWYWYGSDTEANAYYLKLLAVTDGKGKLASELARYLINNRKHASYWNSTRDTAICIEALADYIRASGENQPNMNIRILVDGKQRKEITINSDNLFTYDNRLTLAGAALSSGPHTVQVEKEGAGSLYFNAYLTNFTLEDPIAKTGLEIKVSRKICKITPEDSTLKTAGSRGQPLDEKVRKFSRQELTDLSTLKIGDTIEVELEIDSKNDYEYLLFEDMKAAGFEPLEVRSGYNGNDMGAYMELRDNRVCFFVRSLARGKHSVSYQMRAETPGKFSVLPTRASALYAPELKANSDEMKMTVED